MSDARIILDLPASSTVSAAADKKKPKEKKRDLTGSGVKSKSQRELDKLLKDQKTYLGAHSDVYQEVKTQVRQSLLEEKKRMAEEEWKRSVADRQSRRKLSWGLCTNPTTGGDVIPVYWAPLPEDTNGATDPPVLTDFVQPSVGGACELTLSEDEWKGLEKHCMFPTPWTVLDVRVLLDAVLLYGDRWYLIADRTEFSFTPPDSHNGPLLIRPSSMALMYYSVAHHVISQRMKNGRDGWQAHPLSVYRRQGEPEEVTHPSILQASPAVRPLRATKPTPLKRPVESPRDSESIERRRVGRPKASVDGTYIPILSPDGSTASRMHSIRDALLFPRREVASSIESRVDAIINEHVKPYVWVATGRVYEKVDEIRRCVRNHLEKQG